MNVVRYILFCCYFLLVEICAYAQAIPVLLNGSQILALTMTAKESGNYDAGIKWAKQFFDCYLNTVDCHWTAFTSQIQTLKYCMYAQGMFEEYDDYKKQLIQKIDTERQGRYLRSFVYLLTDYKGNYYQEEDKWHTFCLYGDNTKALQFFYDGIQKISQETIRKDPFVKVWLYILEADLYMYGKDFLNAQTVMDKAIKLVVEIFGKDSREYVVTTMFQEILYAYSGNLEKAISLALNVEKVIYTEKNEYKEWYALSSRLQYYYRDIDLDKSINYGCHSVIRNSLYNVALSFFNFRKYEGEGTLNSPSSYLTRLNKEQIHFMLADAYYEKGDMKNAALQCNKILYLLSKEIKLNYNDFAFNKASEHLKRQVDYLVKMAPLYSYRINGDSLLQSLAYDAALLYKQLTLNADKMFRNHIASLHNTVLTQRYSQLEQTRKRLDNAEMQTVDSLLRQINRLELNLLKHVNNRMDYAQIHMPTWIDIKTALKPEEVAIEFTSYQDRNGKTMYLASVVASDYNHPTTVTLFEESMLDSISDIYQSPDSYELLWKPLEPYFTGKKCIYFSPTRKLHQIGIEYFPLPQDSDRIISDDYSLYRLSSTKELISSRKGPLNIKNAILYGGIKYELNEEELAQKDEIARGLNFFNDKIDSKELNESVRAGLVYLPGTKLEIDEITGILTKKSIEAASTYGEQATESSIKMLSGHDISILHIATHGFYMKRTGRTRLGRLLAIQDSRSTFEEQSLNRAGLMFAGAANSVNEGHSSSEDDGILTAKEISRLDFTQINLVVLSACETGLGDLNSEGIFGLQRGLKRAGAKSIVMSLWKVDDKATQVLMIEFYRNLATGKSERESFEKAQSFLRTTENGCFSDPVYWASFVILDACN